ncbi:TonB-dependent receptor [Alteraurantiacibacter buctensis]|uniref:TonB-dependent receptor n=1 Tax=Alteraurantiacibacter buctensis TaxID=1503981 RepID=A0A844YTV9_9SPHN|nr:TonB-dependent receptor [Alteraurantiacibacter buctensis]MXO70301.1 TonB-dependent receptor [Alteraurantiacibacter buctensis]
MHCFSRSLLAATALLPSMVQAQSGASPATSADDLHDADDYIVVTAAGIERLDVVAGTSVLDGEELLRNQAGQIGEVLADLPGVTSSGFAPGVSRPVLRGFGGERVRVLTDGVGAIDASSTSDDHAVSIDPLIASRIEVLRGPAVLLYGSQAIGGAVNVITKRIPPSVPDEAVHVDALAAVDSASNLAEGGLSVDVPLSGNVAFHIDGSYRNTDDLRIPGFAASPALRAQLLAAAEEEAEEGHDEEAEELIEGANVSGRLPNSWTETKTFGAGIAAFSGGNSFGMSFDYYDTAYGIPGLPGVGHVHEAEHEDGEEHEEEEGGHGDEAVSIGMKRYRVDLRVVVDLGDGFFDEVQVRGGVSDYTHTEFEGDETGTVFDVEGYEGRLELVQSLRGNWRGSLGAQASHTNFSALGDEALVPSNSTDNVAVFALQEIDLAPIEIEFGGRYEHVAVDATRSVGVKRTFDTVSGAVGASYGLVQTSSDDLRLGFNLSHAERAPTAQELFADGPHIATQQYEVGSATLGTERSWGAEGYLRGNLGDFTLTASVYRNWFSGFIYLAETAAEEDGLPVFQFRQQDADQFGLEGEISVPLVDSDAFRLTADVRGDYVRATLANGDPVPRIPPLSLAAALEASMGHFDARAEVQWASAQNRVAQFETPTDDYTMVNLSLGWHPLEGSDNVTLLLQADNVFDVEARNHASFTKEFVPMAGRNVKLTARASF